MVLGASSAKFIGSGTLFEAKSFHTNEHGIPIMLSCYKHFEHLRVHLLLQEKAYAFCGFTF